MGETVTIEVTATIAEGTTSDITNIATYHCDNDDEDYTDECTLTVAGQYTAEKWIVDKDGNILVDSSGNVLDDDFTGFAEGDTITFRVKFTNIAGETIEDLYLKDLCYDILCEYNDDVTVTVVDRVSNGNSTYPIGTSITDSKVNEWVYYYTLVLEDINMERGESITLEYSLELLYTYYPSISKYYYTGCNVNTASFYNDSDYDNSTPLIESSVEIPISDSDFNVTKEVDTTEVDLTNTTAEELATKEFEYTITISSEFSDWGYVGNTYTITDKLPDGMELVDGSIEVYSIIDDDVYSWADDGELTVTSCTLEDGILTIEFCDNYYTMVCYGYLQITYKTKLTDDKINELLNSETSTVLTNKVTQIVITNSTGTTQETVRPAETADVTFKNALPAAGFAKKAVMSFAGKTYYENRLNPVNNGYITAGNTLIWHLIVYNGDGTTNADDTLSITNYSVTDILPSNYKLDDGTTGFEATWHICNLNSDGEYWTSINSRGQYTFNDVASGDLSEIESVTNSDGSTTWYFNGDEYTLAPNQCLVIEFSTVSTKDVEGVITNSGYATFEQNYSTNTTVAGEIDEDGNLCNYANYNIVGLTTESWKTIEYVNQGHNGDPHTDPDSDTGISTEPTNNTVQGMQGEEVIYTLNVTNSSSVELQNFVIIDRLPYVGDLGLVSGYDRNSAFGVTLNEIESVTVDGKEVGYTVTYSTDKTSVLNEYSEDWIGNDDVMSWSSDSTNAINFRIEIDKDVTIPSGATVVVTFTGTVPSYVANTGKSNIAWNSFAYAYQNIDVIGDTVMVAEPAKVGVWVETPDTTIDITINKTLENSKGGTFYFALFDSEDNRISDIVTLSLSSTSTTGTVTMEDIDLASIQYKLENNSNNIYLYETNSKGEILNSTNSVYDVDYENNEISLTSDEDVTVNVTNTKNSGTIEITKKFISTNSTTDTFYFALFTKNSSNEYIRYEDIDVQSVTISGTESGTTKTITFSDVPTDVDFYVFETNSNGVIIDTIENDTQNEYTGSANGLKYTVEGTNIVSTSSDNVTITNTEQTNYKIIVNKILISNKEEATASFYVGLFTSDNLEEASEVKLVSSGSSVTFEYLDCDTTYYYIYECDANGNKYEDTINRTLYYYETTYDEENNEIKTLTWEDDVEFTITYENCEEITFGSSTKKYATIINQDDVQNTITLNKTFTLNSIDDFEESTFTFALYTMNDGDYVKVTNSEKTITITTDDFEMIDDVYTCTKSITFEDLATKEVYYVFEIDNDGNRLSSNDIITNGNNTYLVEYTNNMVYLDGMIPGSVNISNTASSSDEIEITLNKVDVSGNNFSNASLTINNSDGETIATWDTSTDATLSLKGLEDGTYTVKEASIENYMTVDFEFTIKDGYISSVNDNTYVFNSANTLTIVNRAEISISKVDIADKSELAGALITISGNGLSSDFIELSREDTTFTKVDSFDNNETDYTKYIQTGSSISFYSDGKNVTNIIGLADGEYTLTEEVAPDGYSLVTTTLKFTIENGKVTSSYTDDEYSVENNTITVNDSVTTLTISKVEIVDDVSKELEGATLIIKANEYTTIDSDSITMTRNDEDFTDFTIQDNTITFKSGEYPTKIIGLKDGTYTLTENIAPDGYATAESIEFTIENGIVKINGTETDTITMTDILTQTIISKKAITGDGEELEGAKLVITAKDDVDLSNVTSSNNEITVDNENKTITFTSISEATVISGLPAGDYTLTEITAPDGYTNSEIVEFTVSDDNTVENTVTMIDGLSEISISKIDATTSDELSGATLTITAKDGTIDTTLVKVVRGDNDVTVDDAIISTEKIEFTTNGTITNITGLKDGTYILTETTAPNGYATTESIEFTIKNGKVVDSDNNTIEMTDKITEITISKISITDNTFNELNGATLKITSLDGKDLSNVTATQNDSTINITYNSTENSIQFTSGDYETVLKGLPAGDYELEEIQTPSEDYQIAETITFTLNTDGTISNVENAYDNTDSTIVMLDKVFGQVSISKIDSTNSSKEIKGANLEVTLTNGTLSSEITLSRTIDGEEIILTKGVDYTIEDNTIKFTSADVPTIINNLGDGIYTLKETNAPDGYIISTDTATFTIENGVVTGDTSIKNTPIFVSISKKAITGDGEELEGAELVITAKDDVDLSNVTSSNNEITVDNENKTITFTSISESTIISGLPAGDYTLTEITAPDGYTNAETVEFTVSDDSTVENTVTMIDDLSEVSISKIDATTSDELSGATLTITAKDGIIDITLVKVVRGDNDVTVDDAIISAEKIEFTTTLTTSNTTTSDTTGTTIPTSTTSETNEDTTNIETTSTASETSEDTTTTTIPTSTTSETNEDTTTTETTFTASETNEDTTTTETTFTASETNEDTTTTETTSTASETSEDTTTTETTFTASETSEDTTTTETTSTTSETSEDTTTTETTSTTSETNEDTTTTETTFTASETNEDTTTTETTSTTSEISEDTTTTETTSTTSETSEDTTTTETTSTTSQTTSSTTTTTSSTTSPSTRDNGIAIAVVSILIATSVMIATKKDEN